MSKNKNLSGVLVFVVALVVSVGLLAGLNTFTGPLIESNGSAAAYGALLEVMPEGTGFEPIFTAEDGGELAGEVAPTVTEIYKETSGLGYVLKLSTTEGYTHEPIEFTMAVNAEGKISGMQLTNYPETKDFSEGGDYPSTYIGQDSALSEVAIVAGVTYSSSAFKNAVTDGFNALIDNGLVGAGVKGDDQILMELLPGVFPGIANPSGVAQYEEASGSGSVTSVMAAGNGSGVACMVSDGEATYLGVCGILGDVRIYDVEGNDVTGSVDAGLVNEVRACGEANLESFDEGDLKKLAKKFKNNISEDAEFTSLDIMGVFNSVTSAFEVVDNGVTYYAFVARPYGYGNDAMVLYYLLDETGAIVAINDDDLILIAEYFTDYTLEEDSYRAAFAGLTGDTYTGEQAVITGATVSTQAVDAATSDVFDAYSALAANDFNGGNE